MNFIGKLFVNLFGVGSIICLMTAVAIYTQNMRFVTPKGETSKQAINRVEEAIETTKSLQYANNRAYTRWMEEYDELVKLEVDQFNRREFYLGQIELLRTGKLNGKDEDNPIQKLVRDPATGLLEIDMPTGRPSVKVLKGTDMVNAQTQSVYSAVRTAAQDDIKRLQVEAHNDYKSEVMASSKINGAGGNKGLRTRIDEQEQIAEAAAAETLYLEDFITNRQVDAQLSVKRRDALEARITRLLEFNKKKVGAQGN